MALFDFLAGQFVDVIAWTDDTRDTMVWRFERYGHEIKYGAKLTVREGQAAVFVHEGQLADVFGPGLYKLETNNMPIMTTLQSWPTGFQSPFKSEIYFVSLTRFTDQKWGTKNPITMRDPEFGPVRVRAFGTYALRVTDPGLFVKEIVGTDGEFTTDEVTDQIRNVVVQEVSRVLASSKIPVLDMAANTQAMGKLVADAIEPTIKGYGLAIPEFYIENVSLPEEVERVLDKRTSMGIVGDLGRFAQFSAAEALGTAAANPGAAGAGMGTMVGLGLGGAAGVSPWGQAPAQAAPPPPPPPPPAEARWHVARDGQTLGPFGRAELARMAARAPSPATASSGPRARTAGRRRPRWPRSTTSSPRSRRPRRSPASPVPQAARRGRAAGPRETSGAIASPAREPATRCAVHGARGQPPGPPGRPSRPGVRPWRRARARGHRARVPLPQRRSPPMIPRLQRPLPIAAAPPRLSYTTGFEGTQMFGHGTDVLDTTEHATRFRDDLGLLARDGLSSFRCCVPWHKVERVRGAYDWSGPTPTSKRSGGSASTPSPTRSTTRASPSGSSTASLTRTSRRFTATSSRPSRAATPGSRATRSSTSRWPRPS
jgi:membrane protease subunit (stomatin/prohibitin family)